MICYDIACDRRRLKVSKFLETYGVRVQKSVFEAVLSESEYQKLENQLAQMLNEREDRLSFYPLSVRCRRRVKILGIQPTWGIDDAAFIV